MDVQAWVAVGVPVFGGIVWLLRLEGRVNVHEQRHNQTADDVKYIRQRIDRALNGRHD